MSKFNFLRLILKNSEKFCEVGIDGAAKQNKCAFLAGFFSNFFRKILGLPRFSKNTNIFLEKAMRKPYPRRTFEALYAAIAQKMLEQNPPIKILRENGRQDTVQLGIDWYKSAGNAAGHHAAAVMHTALVKAGVIDANAQLNFGKLLYNKYNELTRAPGSQEVVIQGREYNDGLLRFLGYDTIEAFEAAAGIVHGQASVAAPDEREAPLPPPPEAPFTYYIGVYYSFRSYRVNKFVLAIQYADTPTQPMDCRLWGFHVTERLNQPQQLPKKVNSVHFNGKAEVRGPHLYINLFAPASNNIPAMEMHLVGLCDEPGGGNLRRQEAIPCALQTVSLDLYTVSVEACLLGCTEEEAMQLQESPAAYCSHHIAAETLQKKPARERALQLYLMLQRRNFRVKFKPNVSDLDNLEYRGNLVSKYTGRLNGEYRIWNFGLRRGVVVQSKLVIDKEAPYQAFFYPYLNDEFKRNNPGLEEQLAVLVISNEIRQDQLCFATFIKRKLALVNYAIFDIGKLNDDNWAEGMFVTTGYDEKGIIGGYAVMCKVKPGETCEPLCMEFEAAEKYARQLGLTDMHNGLRSLWKRKLWRQKSNTLFECFAVPAHPEKGILMVRRDHGPYAGLFDLPGGRLLHGETPEEGLRRSVGAETGIRIDACSLWANESVTIAWERPDGIKEKLHHIGALYQIESPDFQIGQLQRQAFWIMPGQYGEEAFSPFALKALKHWSF